MHWFSIVTSILIAGFAFLLLRRQGLLRGALPRVGAILLLTGAFVARLFVFGHETLDYQWFLGPWVQHFRDSGGFSGFSVPVGNYHVTYLYFLALFSYIPVPDLYLIKLLSIFFDVILAYFVMQTVGLYTQSVWRRRTVFFAILYLPTVFLNGAYWGQCDSIFTAFLVMSFYYAMKRRPTRSMVMLAISFAFKLQAVFLFPLYLVFLFTRQIRLRHLAVFPVTYLLVILPAVLLGRPFWDTVFLYFQQASPEGRGLNYNSPSIFALYQGPRVNPELAWAGIIAAFVFVALIYLIVLFRHRRQVSNGTYLTLALLFVIGVPFFLPQMHERYFFPADIFAVIFGFARLRFLPAIALTQFASLLGYYTYLNNRWPPVPIYYGTYGLMVLLAVLVVTLLLQPRAKRRA
ncbi:MAG: glycosyltransferase 87 family protein [Oscillospiraceae bacterium]|nr:glycosyltransferase 87 family protein [Oscillospiraceae bacterium]